MSAKQRGARPTDSKIGGATGRPARRSASRGTDSAKARRDALLEIARGLADADVLAESAGATSPHAEIVVLRVLAPVVEPAMHLLRRVWQAWRSELWKLPASSPRIWSM